MTKKDESRDLKPLLKNTNPSSFLQTTQDPKMGYLGLSLYPGDEVHIDGAEILIKSVEDQRVRIVVKASQEKIVKRVKFVQD